MIARVLVTAARRSAPARPMSDAARGHCATVVTVCRSVLAEAQAALDRHLKRAMHVRLSRSGSRCEADGGWAIIRRFAAHRTGATAVEFAILAVPFLSLFCVVAESGLVAIEQQSLDIAVDRGVRLLRTGIFQDAKDGSDPSQRFRRIVCGSPSAFFPCADLRLDVSRATSSSASQPAEPYDKTKKTWATGFGTRFDCPQGGDTVSVRVAVPVMRLFQIFDFTGRIMSDKTQMLIATEIFRAESFEPKQC